MAPPEGVVEQPASAEEIVRLFAVYREHTWDAGLRERSIDARYCTTFDAGLTLAKIAVRAHGWRVKGSHDSRRTLIALCSAIIGVDAREFTVHLERPRRKRNRATYDEVGTIPQTELDELRSAVDAFERTLLRWLKCNHPELLESESLE